MIHLKLYCSGAKIHAEFVCKVILNSFENQTFSKVSNLYKVTLNSVLQSHIKFSSYKVTLNSVGFLKHLK